MAFLQSLRTPNVFGYPTSGNDDDNEAGDMYGPLMDQILLERRQRLQQGSRLNHIGRSIAGPGYGVNTNTPNVIYDRGPEEFAAKMKLQKEDLATKAKIAESLGEIKKQDANTREDRAEAYRQSIEQPMGRILQPKGGNAVVINPRTGEVMETGVDTGTMTDEDKLVQAYKNSIGKIEAQGGQSRQTGAARDMAAMERVKEQGNQSRLTQSEKPISTPQSAEASRIQELINKNPGWAPFVTWDGNRPVVALPDTQNAEGSEGHPNLDTWRQINKALYEPQSKQISEQPGKTGESRINPNIKPVTENTVRMRAPNGQVYNIPMDQVKSAEARGAKRVQ